eukprot:242827-Prymnesium_polylepis.1
MAACRPQPRASPSAISRPSGAETGREATRRPSGVMRASSRVPLSAPSESNSVVAASTRGAAGGWMASFSSMPGGDAGSISFTWRTRWSPDRLAFGFGGEDSDSELGFGFGFGFASV